jgi:signal transduction histidine kinase/CheY-like chemotaxis protein
MIGSSMRWRMAFATLFPVLLVVFSTAAAFWHWRVQDLEDAHRQRIQLLAHQVSIFSANGLFSGNTASLQKVISEVQREPGLRAVYVFDQKGELIAHSGGVATAQLSELSALGYVAEQLQGDIDVVAEHIQSAVLPLDDLFSAGEVAQPIVLGDTVLEFSRHELDVRKRDSLLTALLIGGLGMALGGVLAYQLGNAVVHPILRIYQMINRIGKGDFSVNAAVAADAPLRGLQESLNEMARRLAWGRDELESRVENVTRELREKMEQAQSATLAKSKFLASASHDLRQPAHALGMFVARLGQLPMDAQMRQLIRQMEASIQSMQDLLDSLLDLSRLDSGTVQVRMGEVDLNALLRTVQQSVEVLALTKGLRLRVRPTTLWAHSDLTMLQRIVVNLALNAVRYTAAGTVFIACRRERGGQGVRVEVWDSGMGIAPEHHEDIFKEFYQLQSHQGDRKFGMGLGLNIVQRSAVLLGHQIVVRSQVGCGSRFSVLLDASPAQALDDQIAHEVVLQSVSHFGGARVMVIEDNAHAQSAMAGLLESWGCTVICADSLEAALAKIESIGVPDIVLSDFQLGRGANGIDAIALIRARYGPLLQACLISGETQGDMQLLAKEAQLTVLHKPVRPAKLRSLLRRLLPSVESSATGGQR